MHITKGTSNTTSLATLSLLFSHVSKIVPLALTSRYKNAGLQREGGFRVLLKAVCLVTLGGT